MLIIREVLTAKPGQASKLTKLLKKGFGENLMSNVMDGFMKQPFDLLLGRRTYEIFAAHWPYIKNDPIADKFNSTHKYVVPMKIAFNSC